MSAGYNKRGVTNYPSLQRAKVSEVTSGCLFTQRRAALGVNEIDKDATAGNAPSKQARAANRRWDYLYCASLPDSYLYLPVHSRRPRRLLKLTFRG